MLSSVGFRATRSVNKTTWSGLKPIGPMSIWYIASASTTAYRAGAIEVLS